MGQWDLYKTAIRLSQLSQFRLSANMKAITLCLLVLVSASCLLSAQANTAGPYAVSLEDMDLDAFEGLLDDDYTDFEAHCLRGIRKVFKAVLKTLRGVNCTMKQVTMILEATTNYLDAIDACGTKAPKDVLAIVDSCKAIQNMCYQIIHLNSELCGPDTDDEDKMSSKKCSWQLFKALMKLTRKINKTLKQITNLPTDTSSCFLDATTDVKNSFNSFQPNVKACSN
ncbi:hypothetical protein KR093_005447 [Drosophila rubida]|uniref:Secreted protein n=1 Tax=Drosophila rubida TaxID=30044 RepID=A0AAD4KD88_9MUSC|nr:hypothetical protein KR093_005447 [Drosophila rubida]